MRISTATIMNTTVGAANKSYIDYINIMNKIAGGKNFTKVSENVPDAVKVLKMDDQIAKLNEYQSNIQTATNEMNFAYDTLGDVNDKMIEISDLIIEAANASTTPESAKAIAEDLKAKLGTIAGLMNNKYLDNYIFAGANTQTMPYVENSDGTYSYFGSKKENADRNLTISEGKTMAYNISGDEIFKTTTKEALDENGDPIEVKTNFFDEMNELLGFLTTEPLDYNKIREKIGVIQDTQSDIALAQGQISSRVSKLDTAKTLNETALSTLTINKAEIEEINIAKASSELANAYTALQASYKLSSTVLSSVSLLDYI